ncbi:metallophosphoesterase family protein [Paenibacillus sp. YN15]|uniref:purple acid phosphatase family protein n=1 Tax=Paenibacillus sp. YN15 TaxID=1742774 RepID=UPI00215CAA56|nr:metallophosphoesterase family protein [Paenibacillus sp. YN15]
MKWSSVAIWSGVGAVILVVLLLVAKESVTGGTDKPYSIGMTFRGEASDSRAFTWRYGQGEAAGLLQVAASRESLKDGESVMSFPASHEIRTGEQGKPEGVYRAEATGLTPNTRYWYRLGDGAADVWSELASFVTGPEGGADAEVSFLHVADSQGETEADFRLWSRTLNKAMEKYPQASFIVHTGDLTENPDDPAAWRYFFDTARSVLSRVPLMPVTGNHDEVDNDALEYRSRFFLPENGIAAKDKGPSYSFDYGPVHIVVLNTESDLNKQRDWLKKDLAASDKPWRIAAIHRGAYGGNMYGKLEDWVKVFDEYQVDLVLQGHNHEYSRSYPLRGGKITGNGDDPVRERAGTVYVTPNTAGPKFNEKKEDLFYHKVHFQNNKQMFGGITVSGNVLTYRAYDVEGRLLDQFVLEH